MITLIQTKQRIIIHQIFPTTNETQRKNDFFFFELHILSLDFYNENTKNPLGINNYKSRK